MLAGSVPKRDRILLEGLQDAAAKFAQDGILLVDADANRDRIGDDAARDAVDTRNVRVSDCDVFECGVVANGKRGGAQDGEYLSGSAASVDGEGERGYREIAG